MRLCLPVAALLVATPSLGAQTGASADSGRAWLVRTRALLDADSRETRPHAKALADSARRDFARRHDRRGEADALVLTGIYYYNTALEFGAGSRIRSATLDSAVATQREAQRIARSVAAMDIVGTTDMRLGDVERRLGRMAAAIAAYRRSLPRLRTAYDTVGEQRALVGIVRAFIGTGATRGTVDSARKYVGRVSARSSLAERRRVAERLSALASAEEDAAKKREALVDWQAALELVPEDSLETGVHDMIAGIGRLFYDDTAIRAGGYDSAAAYFSRAARLERLAGHRKSLTERLVDVGDANHRRNDRPAARAAYEAAILVADSMGALGSQAYVHRNFADLLSDWSENDSAAVHYRFAATKAELAGDTTELLRSRRGLADVFSDTGYSDSAIVYYRRLLPLIEAQGDSDLLSSAYLAIGGRLKVVDSLPQAMIALQRALKIGIASYDTAAITSALSNIADLLDGRAATRDSAARVYARVERLTRAAGLEGQRAQNLIDFAYVARRAKDTATARKRVRLADSLARSITDWPTVARADGLVANWFDIDRRLDSSIVWRQRTAAASMRASNFKDAAEAYRVVAELFYRTRRADSAMFYYRKSVAAAGSAQWGSLDYELVHSMALVYSRLGLPDSALAFGDRALAARRARHDRAGEMRVIRYLALQYSDLGRMSRAVELSRQAYDIAVELKNRSDQAYLLNNVGWELSQLGRFREAAPLLRQAVDLARELHDTSLTYHARHSLGYSLERMGQPDSAMVEYWGALELRRAYAASTQSVAPRLDLAVGLNYLADVVARTSADSALSMFQEAEALAREARDDEATAEALRGIGAALFRRRRAGDLQHAIAAFDSAASIYAFVRGHSGEELNRVTYAERTLRLYEEWTLAWLARAPEIGRTHAALSALGAAARGQAQSLLDLRRGTPALIATGSNLEAAGAELVARVTARHAAALVYFAASDSLIAWSIDAHGAVDVRVVPTPRDTIRTLVATYRRALGVSDARVLARMSARDVGLDRTDESDPIAARLSSRGVEDDDPSTPLAVAARDSIGRRLRTLLMPDSVLAAVADAPELIIVPQGTLALVPFAALPIADSARYLGLRTALRYVPSLAALADAGHGETPREAIHLESAVVVGNPTMPTVRDTSGRVVRLLPLLFAEAEAESIAARLGVRPLIGDAAKESTVRLLLSEAPIIHLATHGYAYTSEERTRDSFVALAPDSTHDGLLTVAVVADSVNLRAELVVLSACQTGLGNLKLAEGTIGLQRAFLAKGARSVLVSLWSVSDSATATLMRQFYKHWLDDVDHPAKVEALKRAENDLVVAGLADPRYWAAFQLVGG